MNLSDLNPYYNLTKVEISSSLTYNLSPYIKYTDMLLCGGGGGGGGGCFYNSSPSEYGAGGGGGGSDVKYLPHYDATSTSSYIITIGAGGAGATPSSSPFYGVDGNAGGTTEIKNASSVSIISVNGGVAGMRAKRWDGHVWYGTSYNAIFAGGGGSAYTTSGFDSYWGVANPGGHDGVCCTGGASLGNGGVNPSRNNTTVPSAPIGGGGGASTYSRTDSPAKTSGDGGGGLVILFNWK